MKIHVGNLSSEIIEDDLREAFKQIGEVESITITKSKYDGQSKVFAFVEMKSDEDGKSAIESLNGQELKGKVLKVSEALDSTESSGGKEGDGSKGGFGGKKGFSGGRGGRGR